LSKQNITRIFKQIHRQQSLVNSTDPLINNKVATTQQVNIMTQVTHVTEQKNH